MQQPFPTVAANGRLLLTFEADASRFVCDICLRLETKLGPLASDLLLPGRIVTMETLCSRNSLLR
jgi:hypothetical protein